MRLRGMKTLCTIEGINIGCGNPGRINLDFTHEAQVRVAGEDTTEKTLMSPEKYCELQYICQLVLECSTENAEIMENFP